MAQNFCSNCGAPLNAGASFCSACGQAQGQAQPQYQQPQYQQPQYAPAGPRPGKGFGITSLVLGILGLIYSIIEISAAVTFADSSFCVRYYQEDLIIEAAVVSVFSILALIFGSTAKNKGYKTGISTSGVVMGIIGAVFCFISIIIFATV